MDTFKCPLCNQNKAYRSYAYPHMVVCRCDDGVIKDVGFYRNKVFTPSVDVNSIPDNNANVNYLFKIQNNYEVRELTDEEEIKDYGFEFKNALSHDQVRKSYMQAGRIFTADFNGDKTNPNSFMFYIDRRRNEAMNFVLHNNNFVENETLLNELREELRKKNLIS